MKKTMIILTLFLLLLLPLSAMAEKTGSVKVMDNDGNDITHTKYQDESGISHENVEEGEEDVEEGGDEETTVTNETIIEPVKNNVDMETSIKAVQTAGENALNGFFEGIIDSFYEGSVSIYDTDVTKDDEGTVTYNIQVRELKPFEHPLVVPAQLITFCFLILVTIITILGSMLLAAFQTKHPEAYGDLKRSVSGEYRPYNPNRVHAACIWSITRPVLYIVSFVLIVYGRNFLLLSMPQTASGVIDAANDNIIIRGITGLAIFIGSFQTSIGEYGVYTFGTLLFVICMITDFLVLANNQDVAKKLETVAWGAFVVFCLCDIINMFCTSYGVVTSQWKGESIFITVGIVAGGFFNFIILAALVVYAILKSKKALGV